MMNYTSWNAYKRDTAMRDKLERDLLAARLKARMPNIAIRKQALNEMNVIRKKLSKLPSKRDSINFMVAHSAPFQNSHDTLRSSWVRGVIYNPVTNTVSLRTQRSSYTYGMSFNHLKNFLRYYSLGRYYNKRIKG